MTPSFFNPERYQQNWDLLAEQSPLAAYRVQWIEQPQELAFCQTDKGEANLFKKRYGLTDYYHAQTGALEEAQAKLTPDFLAQADVIYLFGLGLGYFYLALIPWLRQNPQNHVVILEDDLEVLDCFLHTEQATILLNDPQATLFYFHDYYQDYLRFCQLDSSFTNRRVQFLELPYYALRREQETISICYHVLHNASLMTHLHNEYLSGQTGFLRNFYRNLLTLPSSYLASGLFQKFKNIPAIICGAGPSIHKNIRLLKSLTDKALIFAGGSSLNVLNHAGLLPHFGLGVDPNFEQQHRLLTNHTFHLPFLYRQRMDHDALKLMQGPKIYIPGAVNPLASWFEKQLNISFEQIDEGHNVINLCTEIAYRMGCNPIIFVGLDLAFTDIQTYALGVSTHPLWLGTSQPYETDKEAVNRLDIYGQPIKTKWDWIAEATWLSQFAKRHTDIQFINATEGGLGFPPIPNKTLAETAASYLTHSYDVPNWVHAEIQNHSLGIKQTTLLSLLNQLKESLERCLKACATIIEEKINQLKSSSSPLFYTTPTILQESNLKSEAAYQSFLEIFDKAYAYLQSAYHITCIKHPDLFLEELDRLQFLQSVASQNLSFMTGAVQRFIFSPPPLAHFHCKRESPYSLEDKYTYEHGRLQIKDTELQIFIDEPFEPESSLSAHYPNEHLQYEMFYLEGQLHGPSRFYQENGSPLAESWFFKGKRQGKSVQYFASGALYSIQRYRDGHLQGKQEYFFENGSPHVILHYQGGWLEGDVLVYTVEGRLIRELHYHRGKRHGEEKMWDAQGNLLIECRYQEGVPIGEAREWHSTGQLIKQVTIHHFPNDFDLSAWNEKGGLIKTFEHGREDFSPLYQETQKKVEQLEESIQAILQQIDPMIKQQLTETQESASPLAQDMADIKESLRHMQELKDTLTDTIRSNLEQAEEIKRKRQPPAEG